MAEGYGITGVRAPSSYHGPYAAALDARAAAGAGDQLALPLAPTV
jgi:hypothetical protein